MRRRCDIQCDRISDPGFVVVGIALRQPFHRLQVFLHTLAIGQFIVVGIKNGESVDVIALALRLGVE